MNSVLPAEFVGDAATRSDLIALQGAVTDLADPTNWDLYLTHYFAPGVYVRRFDLPKGTLVVGKIHKHAHMNLLLGGIVEVASEFHKELFAAPRIWKSEPGIKRAVLTLEDAMWVTVHPNPDNCTDTDEIEKEVIAPSYEQLDAFLAGRLEDI